MLSSRCAACTRREAGGCGFGEGADVSEPSKLKRKHTVSRQEAAAWLSLLAEAVSMGGTIDVSLAGDRIILQPAEEIRAEIELKSRPDKQELEIELSWSPPIASEATSGTGTFTKSEAGLEPGVVAEPDPVTGGLAST